MAKIFVIGLVFWWDEEEHDTLVQTTASKYVVAHVQETTIENSHWDELK